MSGPCDWDWVEFLTVEDIAWLTELPYTISIPSLDALVVHAGLVPRVPLQQQSQEDIVNIRNVIQTAPGVYVGTSERDKGGVALASLWGVDIHTDADVHIDADREADADGYADRDRDTDGDRDGDRDRDGGRDGGKPHLHVPHVPHVYFGHDARRMLQKYPHATGLDTGCVWGRDLTAVVLPGGELVRVKAQRAYQELKEEWGEWPEEGN